MYVFLLMLVCALASADKQCEDPNARWSECPSLCPETCSSRVEECTKKGCGKPRCDCIKGYVPDSTGRCQPIEECEKCRSLGPFMEYRDCGSNCPTCANPDGICTKICGSGCFCVVGRLPNSWNQCILAEKCRSCGANQEFREGVSGCPPTCEEPNPPFCYTFVRQDECSCVDGYVLNNGVCTDLEECSEDPGCEK